MPRVKYMSKRYKLSDILDRNYVMVYERSLKNPEALKSKNGDLFYLDGDVLEMDVASKDNVMYFNVDDARGDSEWWIILDIEKIQKIQFIRVHGPGDLITDEYYAHFSSAEAVLLYEHEISAISEQLKKINRFDLLLKLNI
jgi:hypothetical protein